MNKLTFVAFAFAALAGPVYAADPLLPPPVDAAAFDWSGAYVGIFAGYGVGTVFTNNPPPAAPNAVNIPVAGPIVGVDGGFNWQKDKFVLGIEGDVAWSGIGGTVTGGFCAPGGTVCGETTNWLASIRGRAGIAAGKALLYATGGLAVLNETSTTAPPNVGTTGTFSATYMGYIVGIGAEAAVTDQISLRAEYDFTSYGTNTAPANTLAVNPINVQPVEHLFKVGLNWHLK